MRAEEPLSRPSAAATLSLRQFWYVVGLSKDLPRGKVLRRTVLGEVLAVYRASDGAVAALEDRCLHRAAPLSSGRVEGNRLRCMYHGWAYEPCGKVCEVPSAGPYPETIGSRAAKSFSTRERDGYVYVRLDDGRPETEPFPMPHYGERPWRRVRLLNLFPNDVTNCAENFVDIPHTSFVHEGIFRVRKGQPLKAKVERRGGSVRVEYGGETDNLGRFAKLLNPRGGRIKHVDSFHMPNVTCVEYEFGPRRRFVITSQSVPVGADETLVYTDLSYDYGLFNAIAAPFVRREGQRVIDQDVEILGRQREVLRRGKARFTHTPADVIHVFIESIRRELEGGRDPRALPDQVQDIEFWV